jgi:hypothetical protein
MRNMFGPLHRYRERQAQTAVDAEALIAQFGDSAYGKARRRAREARQGAIIDGNRSADHWDCVRMIIGRKTGRDSLDTATRYLS